MKLDYKITHECRKPAVMTMDHVQDGVGYVNRCCITCDQHWYGPIDAVTEFTGKAWDAYLEQDEQPGEPK